MSAKARKWADERVRSMRLPRVEASVLRELANMARPVESLDWISPHLHGLGLHAVQIRAADLASEARYSERATGEALRRLDRRGLYARLFLANSKRTPAAVRGGSDGGRAPSVFLMAIDDALDGAKAVNDLRAQAMRARGTSLRGEEEGEENARITCAAPTARYLPREWMVMSDDRLSWEARGVWVHLWCHRVIDDLDGQDTTFCLPHVLVEEGDLALRAIWELTYLGYLDSLPDERWGSSTVVRQQAPEGHVAYGPFLSWSPVLEAALSDFAARPGF